MTTEEIDCMGFTWEQLPSGNWNLWHRYPFRLNGMTTITAWKGGRMMTLFHKTRESAAASIRTLELI